MGLWSWLSDLFSGECVPTETPGGGGPGRTPRHEGGGVATLDAPPDRRTSSEFRSDEEAPWWAVEGAALVELVPPDRVELTAEARALENLLVSHFDGHDLNMPPLLHVAERVLALLRSKKTSFGAVAKEIATDQVITAAVLRMANSPLYRGLNEITGLPSAVTRLGARALQTLMMHESLRGAMIHRKGAFREIAEILWARSLACGYIMRALSRFTKLEPEDAFLIGLLHDVGNIIVLRVVQAQSAAIGCRVDLEFFEYLCAETHQEFGELVAEAWKLPPSLKALASDHQGYPTEDDPLRTERLQLQLTDMIASCLGYAPRRPYNILEARAAHDLGLVHRHDFAPFLTELPDSLDELMQAL